ncbi:hypothetical protein K2173_022940 [Erythroxylum novogranatense]|uniref:Response regulatory domain-containing protein n=1 Tax=Erythroxylum novogranatense TaxID=1862640 RepID=A0AAV8T8V7_9ROSI|nr:hypothetical protein K2173_022940 [Erythroxylum novogranatense]
MEVTESSVESTQQEKQQRQEEKERQRKEEQEEERREEQQQHHFHVLAVDDSVIDRKLLERLLRVSSYRVTCVDSGDKALEYLGLLDDFDNDSSSSSASSSSSSQSPQQEGLKVNLIMTDYCMPGMTGYDLLKRVKGSSWKDVPVVVMSSENIPSRISMCLEEGAEEFLLKPVRQSDVEKLQQHLVKSLGLPIGDNLDDRDNNNTKTNINHNNLSKRKAMSPEPPERIPKLKGLAIV